MVAGLRLMCDKLHARPSVLPRFRPSDLLVPYKACIGPYNASLCLIMPYKALKAVMYNALWGLIGPYNDKVCFFTL